MKCSKCGEQWNVPAGKSHSFCPSCGSKVESDKRAAQNLDTAQGVLTHIANNFGVDVLLGSKIVSCFADITRSQLLDEKKLIKILADEGALDCLNEALGKPESEQAVAIKRAVARLPFAKAEGEEMLLYFATALGWQLQKPQPAEIPQPIVQHQPKQAHFAIQQNENKTISTINVKPTIGSIYKFADIDWRVLAVENNRALLISEKILEKRPYNVGFMNTTWETCTLRKYFNGEFYNKLGAAKSSIADTPNNNPSNPWYGETGGNATTDKVFLLSLDEVCRYFGDSTANLRTKGSTGSDYYINDKNNSARIANYGSKAASWWWLRSPGYYSYTAAIVYADGALSVDGNLVFHDTGGVRPALWLNL